MTAYRFDFAPIARLTVITQEAFDKLVTALGASKEPTQALIELMKQYDENQARSAVIKTYGMRESERNGYASALSAATMAS